MATYATPEEFKHYARIPDSNTEHDVEIGLALEAASRLVEQYTGRMFDAPGGTSTKYLNAYWSTAWDAYVVDVPDLANATSLVIDVDITGDGTFTESVVAADTKLVPLNGPAPYTKVVLPAAATVVTRPGAVRMTGNFGYPAGAPDTVKQATLMQANVFFNRRSSPYGIAGSPDEGFGEFQLRSAIDPHVRLMLAKYVRWWGAR